MAPHMEITRENASRLWVKQFGKKQKAFDFAGREIARAAYNDRNSDYGWNVDHILPESRGGKTADHNLICCSIKTNDEKADRFPSFKANGKLFEIQRRENHYEIILKSQNDNNDISNENDAINFFDAAQGVKCWRKCKPQSGSIYVTYAKIRLIVSHDDDVSIGKFREFIKELFNTNNIFEESKTAYSTYGSPSNVIFTIFNPDSPLQKDSEEWLTNCTILNTYREYLVATTGICEIKILCGLKGYDNEAQMRSSISDSIVSNRYVEFTNDLAINDLIRINTSAKKELGENPQTLSHYLLSSYNQDKWYSYNYTYTKLSENLRKRIDN